MRDLADVHYAEADVIRVVLDNLSTHTAGALYETFPAEEAHRLLQRLEFHYTPKHASWLNMVEIEIGVLRRQCLDRRIGERDRLEAEIATWQKQRNETGARIKWRFTTERARVKLARAYPKVAKKSRIHCDGVLSGDSTSGGASRGAPLHRNSLRREVMAVLTPRCSPDRSHEEGARHTLRRDQSGRWQRRVAVSTMYCARGQMENLIKLHKTQLHSDRTSSAHGSPIKCDCCCTPALIDCC